MNRSELKEILADLEGDEHAWVDFKEDYFIGGIGPKKAEFIRDICSLANTITDRDQHFLFVGVNDDGHIVGISDGSKDNPSNGPRHIFSYDESDIQELIDSNLEPAPNLSWHTFEEGGKKFGALIIIPSPSPPVVIKNHINDDSGNRLVHKGLAFIRKGSGKKIADNEEFERIIRYRIEKQRDQILDGVHKAIDIGPEWIERIGDALPQEPGIPLSTAQDPDEADVEFTQRITREPASSLDEQLNEDIAQWKGRGDDFVEPGPLYRYYSNAGELRLDTAALKFLTQSSIKNYLMGIYWLYRTDEGHQRDFILSTPDKHHRIVRASRAILLMDDEELFDNLMDVTTSNPNLGKLRQCKQKMGNTVQNKVRFLQNNPDEYTLKYSDWKLEVSPRAMEIDELLETIPAVCSQLVELQKYREDGKAWATHRNFREALWDLEVALGAKTLHP